MHTLPDGTQILIRPIQATDKARLSAALGRLSRETIQRRFLAAKPKLSSSELRYLTEVDGHDHIALVAVLATAPDVDRRGGALRAPPGAPDTAEFAIVVGDPLQGRGLGSLLARELATARARPASAASRPRWPGRTSRCAG